MDPRHTRRTIRARFDDLSGMQRGRETDAFWAAVRAEHPRFRAAVAADARVTALRRGERHEFRSSADVAVQVMRLCLVTESFLGQCCYRAKAALQARRVPVVPRLLHHMAVRYGQVNIGDPVMIEPGIHIPHGQICLDGVVRIGTGTTISPFVTIGLQAGEMAGPTVENHVLIGTGAKVIGAIRVGEHATIGANAVVVDDVDPHTTVVGVPARPHVSQRTDVDHVD